MSTYGPAYELRRRVVMLLRDDPTLSDIATGMLFPSYAPQTSENDLRVFAAGPDIPGGSIPISAFPRVTIETIQFAHNKEQEDPNVLQAPCKLWVHTTVEQVDEDLAEQVDAYVTKLLLSTGLSDARIIAGQLTLDGPRRDERLEELNGARAITTGFASALVGSLQ